MKDIKNFLIDESYNDSSIEKIAKQIANIINAEKNQDKKFEAFRVLCDYLDDELSYWTEDNKEFIDLISYFEDWKKMNK